MKIKELLKLFEQSRRRCLLLGNAQAGALIGLDLEGRIYAFLDSVVLNRANPDALLEQSHADQYHNPGGDGFWPAPEGSRYGYFYPAGKWRVPPALSSARYRVTAQGDAHATAVAELDLINSAGRGIPVAFERNVAVALAADGIKLVVQDTIRYLGSQALSENEARLAPWTLAQFDTSPGMEVVFPAVPAAAISDFYEPSTELRRKEDGLWRVRTEGGQRFQLGLAPEVEWIELRIPARNLRVRRTTAGIAEPQHYIDVADRPPTQAPSDFAARYSIYNDAGDFMEIEAAGPGAPQLTPGLALTHTVTTDFRRCQES